MIASAILAEGEGCANAPRYVSIGDLAKEYAVSPSTLRRLVDSKVLPCFLTEGRHRRIPAEVAREYFQSRMVEQKEIAPVDGPSSVIIYGRVSSQARAKAFHKGEESDLTRQLERCRIYALEKYGDDKPTIYTDISSGLNDQRAGLIRMLDAILAHKYDGAKLILTFKDRLARFGTNIILRICEAHNISVTFIEATPTEEMEKELADDIISLLQCFSAKHYGMRASKRLSVKVGDRELREVFALHRAGYSVKDIVRHLRKEGRAVGECGRPITIAVVIRLIKKNKRVINEVVPSELHSFAKWFGKHCRQAEGTRTQRKPIMAAYKAWLAEHPSEVPVNDTGIGLWFKRQGIAKRFGNGGEIIYLNVELR